MAGKGVGVRAVRNGVRAMGGPGPTRGAPKAVRRSVGATRRARAVGTKATNRMGTTGVNGSPGGSTSPSAGAMTGGAAYE